MDALALDVAQFQKRFDPQQLDFYRPVLQRHAETIKVKREATALPNLQKIFLATLALSNAQGFQAMGLRDLSAATGISLGALYSYINSKEHLLCMVLEHVNGCLTHVISEHQGHSNQPRQGLADLLRALLYLSEAIHPWLFFATMEAPHLPASGDLTQAAYAQTIDSAIIDALNATRAAGELRWADTTMAAALIKPLVQEWSLNRAAFAARALPVEHYADAAIAFVEQALLIPA